ncbi:hypothetical protein AX16_004295 [Volvariella volvacea WC 439]|nr:hypothetical protein AX16_004295 [Volvariella volvacea WC 439]
MASNSKSLKHITTFDSPVMHSIGTCLEGTYAIHLIVFGVSIVSLSPWHRSLIQQPWIHYTPEVLPHIYNTSAVTVHHASITRILDAQIHISNGNTLNPDVVICATGWKPYPSFFSPSDSAALGLPTFQSQSPIKLAEKWDHLESEALARLRAQFHLLAAIPSAESSFSVTLFRIYNHIASTEMIKNGDNSLAFLGFFWSSSICIQAEVTSL